MAHCTCKSVLSGVFAQSRTRATAPTLSFLLPAFSSQTASFSTTSSLQKRKRKDGNPHRGESALYRSGLNRKRTSIMSVRMKDLPQPVRDPERLTDMSEKVDPYHGLWDFFPEDKSALMEPGMLSSHGRGWTIPELRAKSWNDLHCLWWACIKEMNLLTTNHLERIRIGDGKLFGGHEQDAREKEIKKTKSSIKFVLTERWYAYEDARRAARHDPTVNLNADYQNGEPSLIRTEAKV